jgi:AraC family transcriptional regulator
MRDIANMTAALDFIEANLMEEITVADVAASVAYSLYHFSRTFSRIVRHTPYDYLMRRRLSEAARCLLETDDKIIDIAFNYQFNAPETFSRAFKRMFYLQPRQVKAQQRLDRRRLMPKLSQNYLAYINSGASLIPVRERIAPLRIAGIASEIDMHHRRRTVTGLWKRLAEEINFDHLNYGEREFYGIVMYSPSSSAKRCMYLAGISLPEVNQAPPYLVEKSISAVDGIGISLPEQKNAAQFTRDYIYHTWWPKATDAPLPAFELERYRNPPHNENTAIPEAAPTSIWIPMDSS